MALTKEQRAERTGYIGGTDAAAVMGLSRYKTPLSLWSEKTGAIVPKNRDGELPILLGNLLEDVVADLYTFKTGVKLRRVKDVQVHPKYPFLRAQIDRRAVGSDKIVECKTASAFKAGEWEGADVPTEYIFQGLHQLMVTGAESCDVACLIGGNVDFVWKTIERDEDMIRELEKAEVAFWENHILKREMPGVTTHDAPTLMALFPKGRDNEVEPITLPEHFDAVIARLKEIGSDKSGDMGKLVEERDALQNEIKVLLGENTHGVVGNYVVTWKNQDRTSLDSKLLFEEAPEVYAKYQRVTPIRTFRTTDITKKRGAK